MIDSSTIARLTPYIVPEIDFIGTGTVRELNQRYANHRGVPILCGTGKKYPISSQALLHHPEKGDGIVLAWQDHPYLNDWQGLHGFAHILMSDQLHEDVEHPPAHLLLTDEHEREVSILALMLLVTWESAPAPAISQRQPARVRRFRLFGHAPALSPSISSPVVTVPTFNLLHLTALMTYLDARLAASLPFSPRKGKMMWGVYAAVGHASARSP